MVGNINGYFESVPARICCKFSLLLLPSVVLHCWDVNFLANISLTLNYLSPPPRDIHLLEWLVKQCSLPRQLSESWMEESGMFLYNIFYVSQSKNISSLLIIFLLKIKISYWVLVTLTYALSSKITWNRFPFSTLFAVRSVAKLLDFI